LNPPQGTHLFNHVIIVGKIHPVSAGVFRIVGFEVKARSVHPSRYEGKPSDPSDMSCKIRPVPTSGAAGSGGLVLDTKKSTFACVCVGVP
jgi:transmembrane 9 superfamily protein 2/4